jgi:hypothetical protein
MKWLPHVTILAALGAPGCITHYAHAVSDTTTTGGTPVEGYDEGAGFFLLWVPDLDAATDLRAKCPGGKVTGVETQGTVRNWFGVMQVYKVYARGLCAM